ncbi:hypothetical protein QO002_001123 [Pararhizobium capsulatum DSM 1112]|uniref:Uncharacterized protein n=1 Tax=Pararhizobium capsulatum DSM 1112 TaxID=1121113 RepID=A0ABU0BL65_9HYPH|nr:hypothetical protein [Pararhizobium capsulatum]MDQ0318985.1 hypothetical protein [Pararhizobium capsulatum DSM 1112]
MSHELRYGSEPTAPDLTRFATLMLAMQLHNLANKDRDLGGSCLSVDDDGYLVTPNKVRKPGPLAVSSVFPAGVTVGSVTSCITRT